MTLDSGEAQQLPAPDLREASLNCKLASGHCLQLEQKQMCPVLVGAGTLSHQRLITIP